MLMFPMRFARAIGYIVGICRHNLRLLHSRNCNCTKDYVDIDEDGDDDVDVDNAVLVADADKDAEYDVRTS